ncbi:hypothetical protein R3P38DRAFT_2814713 [Favolaschia claudopus]|uniref:Uncharacterized protein n=1 Tax=Favolaschia claudopus TaxID=2862362 RepID=A0AAV9Z2C5_9AGAR
MTVKHLLRRAGMACNERENDVEEENKRTTVPKLKPAPLDGLLRRLDLESSGKFVDTAMSYWNRHLLRLRRRKFLASTPSILLASVRAFRPDNGRVSGNLYCLRLSSRYILKLAKRVRVNSNILQQPTYQANPSWLNSIEGYVFDWLNNPWRQWLNVFRMLQLPVAVVIIPRFSTRSEISPRIFAWRVNDEQIQNDLRAVETPPSSPKEPGNHLPPIRMWRPADCGVLAVNMIYRRLTLIQTFKLSYQYLLDGRRCGTGGNRAATTLSVKIFLAACLLIERFTAVAGNDSDNAIGVRQGAGSRDEFHGVGSGRWGGAEAAGSSGGRASALKIAFRGSSICNVKTFEPDRALGQMSNQL